MSRRLGDLMPHLQAALEYVRDHPQTGGAELRERFGLGLGSIAKVRKLAGVTRKGGADLPKGEVARYVLGHPEATGADLARRLGVSPQRISQIRKGKT